MRNRIVPTLIVSLSITATATANRTTYDNEIDFFNAVGPLALESYEGVVTGGGRVDPKIIVTPPLATTAEGDSGGEVTAVPFSGQMATDGVNYLGVGGDSGGQPTAGSMVTFDFDSPIHEFGVYAIDFGDSFVSGDLTYSIDGGPPTVLASRPQANGNLIFFGVVDEMASFSQVVLANTISGDSWAVDEVRFSVPEPATGSLFTIAMIACCGFRRRVV